MTLTFLPPRLPATELMARERIQNCKTQLTAQGHGPLFLCLPSGTETDLGLQAPRGGQED